ncbi:MAG TPA: Gfo/Idh/MocA family oxidoreductase [bacterium]|nr:Gfo/Idh/MocA family oxidoreductase [bacterium]
MKKITRRTFLGNSAKTGIAASGMMTLATSSRVRGANDQIVVGVMGAGGRGSWLARAFARMPNVVVAYLCDPDARRLDRPAQQIEEERQPRPKTTQDFRVMLADPHVDAVVNATPDHWHALGTILACQAGKHVYCEKPASHSLWEGRKMVEAARKYNRVVQLGTQTRSAPYAQHAVERLAAGELGEIHYIKVFNMKTRPELVPQPDGPVPEGLNYDLWLGPAPMRPYNPNFYGGGNWNWKWEYSGGDIINDAVHQIDLARWLSGQASPKSVYAVGGIFQLKDNQDSPDTQIVTLEFEKLTMLIQVTLWTPALRKIPQLIRDSDLFPNWPFCATRVEVYGTKGLMQCGRHGGGWQIFINEEEPGPFEYGRDPSIAHIENFLECIRTGQRPNADIEEGHLSTSLCHLANISYRVGGEKLLFDATAERFINNGNANQLLKRTYRHPWVVPEVV